MGCGVRVGGIGLGVGVPAGISSVGTEGETGVNEGPFVGTAEGGIGVTDGEETTPGAQHPARQMTNTRQTHPVRHCKIFIPSTPTMNLSKTNPALFSASKSHPESIEGRLLNPCVRKSLQTFSPPSNSPRWGESLASYASS